MRPSNEPNSTKVRTNIEMRPSNEPNSTKVRTNIEMKALFFLLWPRNRRDTWIIISRVYRMKLEELSLNQIITMFVGSLSVNSTNYRESQKTWDLQDDLETFNRYLWKKKVLKLLQRCKQIMSCSLNLIESFNRGLFYV